MIQISRNSEFLANIFKFHNFRFSQITNFIFSHISNFGQFRVFIIIPQGVPELADQIETVYSLMVMKVKNV
jgi:hypothetical protein